MEQVLRLLQISDTHCYADDDAWLEWSELPVQPNRALQNLLAALRQQASDYDALVISGDLVQEETAESYQRIRTLLQGFPLPVYTLPGNHDIPALMRSELTRPTGSQHINLQPALQIKGWLCLFLDTSLPLHPEGHLSATQLDDLEQRLRALPANGHAFIFMHHPPVAVGMPVMDKLGLQQADAFWAVVERFPQVKGIAFGHIHQEFTSHYQTAAGHTIALYGTPATCVQIKQAEDELRFDHTRAGWRELVLHANGQLETRVFYAQGAQDTVST